MSVTGLSLLPSYRDEQYSPSQEHTKRHLIRAINLSVGSLVISELPHPPKEKYSLAEPQHSPKVKYFLSTDLTKLQGGNHDGNTHTTRHDPQDGLECRRQASCMAFYRERLEQYFVIAGTPMRPR